jgi:hypothetical protein
LADSEADGVGVGTFFAAPAGKFTVLERRRILKDAD